MTFFSKLPSLSSINETVAEMPAAALPAPPSFDDLVAQADRARDLRDWPTAAVAYDAALAVRPAALHLSVQLGHALKESGNYEAAEAAYRRFVAQNAEDADVHLQLGHLFARQERGAEAAPWYQEALRLAPPDSSIARDAERALRDLETLPLRQKRRTALALTDESRFAEALPLLRRLVEEDGCEDLNGVLGNVLKELCDFDTAEICYQRFAVYAQTASPEARFESEMQMGHFEKVRRDYAAALSHFARAKEIYPLIKDTGGLRRIMAEEIDMCLAQITTSIVVE